MLEAKKTKIDGKEITVNLYPARKGIKVKAKLFRYLSRPLFKLVSGIGDTKKFKNIKGVTGLMNTDLKGLDLTSVGEALSAIFENLSEIELDNLIDDLISNVFIGNPERPLTDNDVFNEHISGNYLFLYKIIGYVIKVNYADSLMKGGILGE